MRRFRSSTFSSIRAITARNSLSSLPLGSSSPQSSRWEQGKVGHWTLQPMVTTISTAADRIRVCCTVSAPCRCVDLLHQAHRVGIDAGAGMGAGRAAFKHIAGQLPAQASAIWLRQELWTQRKATFGFSRPRREGTARANALAVPRAVGAYRHGARHPHPQMLPDKVHSGQDGQKGVPLAAPGGRRPCRWRPGRGRSSGCSAPRAPALRAWTLWQWPKTVPH